MPDILLSGPNGEQIQLSDPAEIAAARTRQAVKPEGGRKEGAATAWIESQGEQIKQAIERMIKHPEDLVGGAELGALKLMPRRVVPTGYGTTQHFIDIINEIGEKVGWTIAEYDPRKKSITIDMIESEKPREETRRGSLGYTMHPSAHTLGPREIRSLLPEAKKLFPEAESVRGFRVTGARNATGQLGGTTIPLPGSTSKSVAETERKAEIAEFGDPQHDEAARAYLQSHLGFVPAGEPQAWARQHGWAVPETATPSLASEGPESLR